VDAIEAIHTRRSIRRYEDRAVPAELVEQLLAAAMAAPSARNGQPWRFIVIDDRSILRAIAEMNPNAAMAAAAPLGILVCGDLDLEGSPGYWVIDCAAATQNMLLAAHALGLGAVWTGVWPRDARVEGMRQLFDLPPHVVPHSLVVVGFPAEEPPPQDRYRPERVARTPPSAGA
jgi:nitroreductase